MSKMKTTLVLAMLCVALAGCLELENICSSDSFYHDGLLVNAFYRVQFNVTFQPLSYYLINDTVDCKPTEFNKEINFWQALKIKHE